MNVFGKNERSWRKARKRGVSPIIATILLVAITVVLAAVLYVLISGLTGGGVGSKPIGSAFSAGSPISGKCITGDTYALVTMTTTTYGCLAGDYIYTLTVETTGAAFGNVLFEVKTATGTIDTTAGANGFTVLTIGSLVAAQSPAYTTLAMTGPFSTYNTGSVCNTNTCTTSTPWSSIYTIMIDMGTVNPVGTGLTFVAVGTAGYSGTTSLALP
jgi:flagellin-like protein